MLLRAVVRTVEISLQRDFVPKEDHGILKLGIADQVGLQTLQRGLARTILPRAIAA